MNLENHLKPYGDFSVEALCTRILKRHRDKISIQKQHVAVANLVKIVEATLTLSNRQGFHATSMRDLANATGLSMGGLYSYFDSKDTLLMMILGEVATTVTEVLGKPPAMLEGDPVEHLRWLVEMHVCLTEAMAPWFVFAYMEAKSFPASGRKLAVESEAETESMFASVLKQGLYLDVFDIDDIAFTAALIKPLLQDWYVKRSKWRKRGIGPHDYAKRVFTFIADAIGKEQRLRTRERARSTAVR